MSEYKISVIVAVYNVEKYLEKAFQSLLDQTIGFSNLQIIFVDDNSTDHSRDLVRTYADQYENVFGVYLTENSMAGGRPRNKGVDHAAGKYIMFLDPDDFYDAGACEILYREMEQGDYSCAAGYYKEINEEEEVITENAYQHNGAEPGLYQMPEDLDFAIKIRSGLWAKIYRRDLIEQFHIKEEEGIPGQDMVFFMEYILNSRTLKYVDEPIVYYRVRDKKDKSISFLYNKWFFDGINISYQRCLEILRSKGLENKFALLFAGAINYYIQSVIDSKLGVEEIRDVLATWGWAFDYDKENTLNENEAWYASVKSILIQKEYGRAAGILFGMRRLRKWTADLEEAVSWYQKHEGELERVIKDQKEWIMQIEEARDFFKGQSENYQKEYGAVCESRSSLLQEIQILQKREAESSAKIKEMQIQAEEMFERCEAAGMEAKKWKYKYDRIMDNGKIEKIVKKKGLDI